MLLVKKQKFKRLNELQEHQTVYLSGKLITKILSVNFMFKMLKYFKLLQRKRCKTVLKNLMNIMVIYMTLDLHHNKI